MKHAYEHYTSYTMMDNIVLKEVENIDTEVWYFLMTVAGILILKQ